MRTQSKFSDERAHQRSLQVLSREQRIKVQSRIAISKTKKSNISKLGRRDSSTTNRLISQRVCLRARWYQSRVKASKKNVHRWMLQGMKPLPSGKLPWTSKAPTACTKTMRLVSTSSESSLYQSNLASSPFSDKGCKVTKRAIQTKSLRGMRASPWCCTSKVKRNSQTRS